MIKINFQFVLEELNWQAYFLPPQAQMNKLLTFVFILLQSSVFANMANPIDKGTLGTRPFVNEFVDVIHEDLFIQIDQNFEKAYFNVKYHINASKDGFQIPFLFYASEFLDSFSVSIDGQEVAIKDIPKSLRSLEHSKFSDFAYFFEYSDAQERSTVNLDESDHVALVLNMNDFIYFETDILKGEHTIEVSYQATHWTNRNDWITAYSFRYALSPAKYWKSFGTLSVTIDASVFDQQITTNIGQPKSGELNSKAEWEFNALPTEILQLNFIPKVSKTAEILIVISPLGLTLIIGVLLALLLFNLIIWYRKKHPTKTHSLVVIIGCLILPLVIILCWIVAHRFIDYVIGEHAGRSHGYPVIAIATYPFLLTLFLISFWLLDKRTKKKYT